MTRTVALALAVVACAAEAAPPAWRLPATVNESSGLARSARHPGVFWTHNDSRHPLPSDARLYAVTAAGRLVGTVEVLGATATDWEDLAPDGAGNLWIADLGNNENARRDLALYRVPEPDPARDTQVRVDRVLRVRYPDQAAFPDEARRNFDAEAVFFADGTLWVLTKHRSDQKTTLYRAPALEGDVVLERISDFELGVDPNRYGGMATSADLDPTGRWLAVLSYHAVFVFERPAEGHDWLSRPVARLTLDQAKAGQCEGVAWDGWSLVFSNEDRDLWRVPDPFGATAWP